MGSLVEGNDEAGDCGGREGDWFGERISSMCFVFMVTEVDGEISLKVVGGSAGHDVFKQPSMFNCFPVSVFSFNSSSTEEVAQQVHIPLSTFAFLLPHPHNTSPSLHSWLAIKQFTLKQALWIEIGLNYLIALKWDHVFQIHM